ncbi:hypothetical protein N0V88_006225 [Collariella sp. IMI 366227]|nr:hypothetical protein N0V88_006225 [Collariella sp. IMI 366227]
MRIGLGIGLGIGIPILLVLLAVAWLLSQPLASKNKNKNKKRRSNGGTLTEKTSDTTPSARRRRGSFGHVDTEISPSEDGNGTYTTPSPKEIDGRSAERSPNNQKARFADAAELPTEDRVMSRGGEGCWGDSEVELPTPDHGQDVQDLQIREEEDLEKG